MHGREGEEWKRSRHMCPVSALGTTVDPSNSRKSASTDLLCKDGRKISIGDCALFKPHHDTSPPFIGIIRWLAPGKGDYLKLGVNWLYRPAEVKLGKGILLEAAPNEVFYSFHKDEIPAASLLHPCKVAFLRKGVELPPGISSFVCRRVYDTTNKCLWWLTDKDYINKHQEEVDQLLDKTRLEMHAGVQSGGRSPKPLNGPTTAQVKPGSDSVQNSATLFPSQVKGKKRERGDQGSEPVKRERYLKTDDGDSGRSESMLKSEIAKITDKGGLVDYEGVEKLVQLMQPDRTEKKIDLAGRVTLADVIAATDKFECLGQFVHLRGLSVLDEWLQEVREGKIGDSSNPKESDKSIEEFLFALLRALDKLPVNLHALQTCNVGKSVNHLRSHKNLEIQKKARSLVDTWKKRVEVELKNTDVKPGLSQAVPWPSKPGFSDVSHGGSRHMVLSSEVPGKSSIVQPSTNKTLSVKLGNGDGAAKSTSASPGYIMTVSSKDSHCKMAVSSGASDVPPSPGYMKVSVSSSASAAISSKDSHCRMAFSGGTSDIPLTTMKEEKSSSSSQSQNNSQSCSSDFVKIVGSASKEDARSSTAGSWNMNKTSSGGSRHRRSSNGVLGSAGSGVQKETVLGKSGALNRNATSEKVSVSGLNCERTCDVPTTDHGNNHRLIVRLPNPGRSPARSASGGSFDDPSAMVSRASSPGLSEKLDKYDWKVKGKSDSCRPNIAADVNTESWQSNDVKDGFAGDEGDGSPATVLDEERSRSGDEIGKPMEASRASCSSSGHKGVSSSEPKSSKSYDTISSITALIERCVKQTEASTCVPAGDALGMNLLASVAAGEMTKSDPVSPVGSPGRNSPDPDDSHKGNVLNSRLSGEDVAARCQGQSDGGDSDAEKQGKIICPSLVKDGLHCITSFSGESKTTSSLPDDKPKGDHSEQFQNSGTDLQKIADACLKSDGKPDETTTADSLAMSSAGIDEEGEAPDQHYEKRKIGISENMVGHAVDKNSENNTAMASDLICDSLGDVCNIDNVALSVKDMKGAVEESTSCPSLEMDGENKACVHETLIGGSLIEQKPCPGSGNHTLAVEESNKNGILPSGSDDVSTPKCGVELKSEKAVGVEARTHVEQMGDKKMEQACSATPILEELIGAGVGSIISGLRNGSAKDKSKRKEAFEHCSGGLAPTISVQQTEQCMKSSGYKLPVLETEQCMATKECVSTAETSSLPVAVRLDGTAKLNFDLNEGFPIDEGNQCEPVTSAMPGYLSAVHLPSPLLFPVPPMSSGLPTSITVAAAAKGPFIPPEILLKSKGELGWKGSAATSAFRPAEPRKVIDMPFNATDNPPDIIGGKQNRPPLDFDLNVADERVLEDMASQNSAQETGSESVNYCELGRSENFGAALAPVRSAAGMDFDLNRVDEGMDVGQLSVSNICRLEAPFLPVRSSSSGEFPNPEVNVPRDFDLNNGPGLEEMGTESVQHNQHVRISVPSLPLVAGPRMNNTELGSLSSWFPHGNSYPAAAIPSILSDREQLYPIVATTGMQRILGQPTAGMTFRSDVYRGPVLASSPAVAFPPATALPYPGFPFTSSFPIPSTSFPGGSYIDSSSGGGLCFPAVPSHLVGPPVAVSSHHPRPYVINLSDGPINGGAESSRQLGRQSLDLNAGPGGTDMDTRDERFPPAPRLLSVPSSLGLSEEQMRMYQAVGGALKRREPEGGWDLERFTSNYHGNWKALKE